jgi:hypothetical protein
MSKPIIVKKLNIECTAAGRANLFIVFNMPLNKAVIDIKIKYGKQILPKITVSVNFSLNVSNPETKIFKTEGKNEITTTQKILVIMLSVVNTSDRTIFAFAMPSLCRIFENLGRNDELKAPSAKILRNVFDNLSAMSSASVHIPAPKQNAITHSRKKPITLLKSVNDPTVKAALIIPIQNHL